MIEDKLTVGDTETITAELLRDPPPSRIAWPCLKCGKATKEHVPPGKRICSMDSCRTVFDQEELSAAVVHDGKPRYPCPKCGKETKEHIPKGVRICCMDDCRFQTDQYAET